MALPNHGQPTSAADDGRPSRFPDPPPTPHARDSDAFQEYAALVRRRDELLRELHMEHVRMNMIMRELLDTEYAMAARFTSAHQWLVPTVPWSTQDRWHRRPPPETTYGYGNAPPPPRQTSTCPEHPTCSRTSSEPVRPPPVYPQVDRSPSPGTMSGYPDYFQSQSRQPLTKEALLTGAANADVRPAGSESDPQELACEQPWPGNITERQQKSRSSGQRITEESAMEDQIDGPVQSPCGYIPTGQGNATYSEQKILELPEPPCSDAKQQKESSGTTVDLMSRNLELLPSPRKQNPVEETVVPAVPNAITRPTPSMCFREEVAAAHGREIGEDRMVDVGHGVRPFDKNRNHSSCERKAVEPATGGRIDKPLQQSSQSKLENVANNEQKKATPERTSSVLKRRLTMAAPLAKKQKPLGERSCVNQQGNLDEFPAGRLPQSNVEAPQARIKPAELNVKAMPGPARNWEPVRWDGEEGLAQNTGQEGWTNPSAASKWTCRICDARCFTASKLQHLGGRRHRENTEAILAQYRTSYSRTDVDPEKTVYYCEVCGVRCASDAILAMHLIGRRHQKTLQELELELE